MDDSKVLVGDCREVMTSMAAESVDAIVTDPPYGLSFMGKGWDHGVPGEEFWVEALRVAKPGAHLLAFGGTRTFHRLASAIEDAGWEIRDTVMWVYGQGFPKSLDVSKAIDKAAGAEREVVQVIHRRRGDCGQMPAAVICSNCGKTRNGSSCCCKIDNGPATDAARQWAGWGTALKPAWEPVIVARKPLVGTVVENVLQYGTGGLNIDGCRVEGPKPDTTRGAGGKNGRYAPIAAQGQIVDDGRGRWPANLIHDGSEEVMSRFPETASTGNGSKCGNRVGGGDGPSVGLAGKKNSPDGYADGGSAARFFYCAKASKADRDEGCEGLPQTVQQSVAHGDKQYGTLPYTNEPREMNPRPRSNNHPTVKPTDLMRYLCRLVTPPGGLVLDPFCGSGSTGKAAVLEGFRFVGIEQEPDYARIANARIAAACFKMGKRKVAPPREGATLWD